MNLHGLNERRWRNTMLAGDYGDTMTFWGEALPDEATIERLLREAMERTMAELDVDFTNIRLHTTPALDFADPLDRMAVFGWRCTVSPTIWEAP